MPKSTNIISAILLVLSMMCCCGGSLGWYFWDQFGRQSPPSPPNVYEVSPTLVGLIQVASPTKSGKVVASKTRFAITDNFMLLKEPFSDRSGRWIAKYGSVTYPEMSPYLASASQKGVWSLGTVTAPGVIGDYEILTFYVGTAAEALSAEKTLVMPENLLQIAGKIAKKSSAK